MRDVGTECYHSILNILSIILGIIILIAIIVYIGYYQVQHYKQAEEYCNNKYGINGWQFNETTDIRVNKYYIGQVWECVPLSK